MDSSTLRECEEIEASLGGAGATARLTGSRAHPRFTGPQIRKFAREDPDAYSRTSRIHLVSSFIASHLIGRHAPIDHADGSGMNLMDIHARDWSSEALDATAPSLRDKLPALVASNHIIGPLAERWQMKFGLPSANVVAWSGDNPCSLVGTGVIEEGQLAISLGTSDTIFGAMRTPRFSPNGTGHVFVSPTGEYMGITVFRNGSLARQRIRDAFDLTWSGFSAALRATPAGNDGAMILPWFEPEITPPVAHAAPVRVGLGDAPGRAHVRAIVEGQMIALARHSEWMTLTPRAIHATGGASANTDILQIMADVFKSPVYRFDSTDAAALGAALRGLQAHTGRQWQDAVGEFVKPLSDRISPIAENLRLYDHLKDRYASLERAVLSL
jgi:xylulokinase